MVRIDASFCGEVQGGVGAGFLLDEYHVATVAHNVPEGVTISLATEDIVTQGRVVGIDRDRELALIRAAEPIPGYQFELATEIPRPGQEVTAIGYPEGYPLSVSEGTISGIDRTITVDDGPTLSGLVQTTAAISGGNSGGPLLDPAGVVLGLVEASLTGSQGLNWAVPAAPASAQFAAWIQEPSPAPDPVCEDRTIVQVTNGISDPELPVIYSTISNYFAGINARDFELAYAQLSPRLQNGTTLEQFAAGLQSSEDIDVRVMGLRTVDAGNKVAFVSFRSLQEPELGPRPGETCTLWELDYQMVLVDERWLIDGTDAHFDERSRPCPESD